LPKPHAKLLLDTFKLSACDYHVSSVLRLQEINFASILVAKWLFLNEKQTFKIKMVIFQRKLSFPLHDSSIR